MKNKNEGYVPVILESPYKGNGIEEIRRNEFYARSCMLDSIRKGEAPFVGHLLYTQVLNDKNPDERETGMCASQSWYGFAKKVVVYTDFGISPGMQDGIELACKLGIPIEYRILY